MNNLRFCPTCQAHVPADAPAGVCPPCALRAAMDPTRSATTPMAPSRPPLDIETVARLLPELDDFALLGRGGMGTVFRARHRTLERPVAVKILDPSLGEDEAFAERFAREARTLAQLDHPNIVRVYDFGHREGTYYLMMELVDGVDLRQTIAAGMLTPNEALALVPKICEALQYAHDHGVVHRDVKPENILINRDGTVKIADFGLAKLVGSTHDDLLTRTYQVMGTPNYMAPEQVEKPSSVDHRADIFALGVVLYEMLTGELPLGRFPPPSSKVQVDVRLDEVVLRTLEKAPERRYQQARELQSDVESLSSPGVAAMGPIPAPFKHEARDRGDYEFRSDKELFGLPLVHIAFSRDPEGNRMRTANGIIAIGDMAIGGIAIGGIAIGGISIGGISVGLLGIGGLVAGLLIALGGCGFGTVVTAGAAFGVIANGGLAIEALSLPSQLVTWIERLAWFVASLGITAAIFAGIYAWIQAASGKGRRLA
ncbi:MAG: serine/threonine-protein kinase [Acidobacteriota bacterium]